MFKLKVFYNVIGGVGWMVFYFILFFFVVWDFFGYKNGVLLFYVLCEKIINYCCDEYFNLFIGCILLIDFVFFEEKDWIFVFVFWVNSIV